MTTVESAGTAKVLAILKSADDALRYSIVMSALLVPSTFDTNKDVTLRALLLPQATIGVALVEVKATNALLPVIVVGAFKFGAAIVPYPNKRFCP